MGEKDFCQSCSQKNDCISVYLKVGDAQGPSVVLRVVAAFLLPLLTFIISLAVFEQILVRILDLKLLGTVLGFAASIATSLLVILVIKWLNIKLCRHK